MTTWDIDVPGAGRVIQRAADTAAAYEADLGGVDAATEAAVSALPHSPLVVQRLGEFVQEAAQPHLERIVGHTHSALQGTTDAVSFYVAGDQEMAARAQCNAALASYPTDTPGVAAHGVPR